MCSLPRAGNTLIGSLINQNKNVCLTANSIVPDILKNLNDFKHHKTFHNFPDTPSLNNVIYNVINNYYKDWQQTYIIDRGEWGDIEVLAVLKNIIDNPKFIILHRPVLECLASFVKIEKPKNLIEYCDLMMNGGIIGRCIFGINNIIKNKENYIIIDYYELIKNPTKEIKKIFNFIKAPFFKLKLKNFEQFKVNNVEYNDLFFNSKKIHTIRTNEIKINKYKINKYLPNEIINKYINFKLLI